MRDELDATIAARLEHDKLEALKELAYGASHEINNPLMAAHGFVSLWLETATTPDDKTMAKDALKDKAMEIYREFLTKFPGSVYAAEARKRFRTLRGDFIPEAPAPIN